MDQLKNQLAEAYAEEFLEVQISLSQLTAKSSTQRLSMLQPSCMCRAHPYK